MFSNRCSTRRLAVWSLALCSLFLFSSSTNHIVAHAQETNSNDMENYSTMDMREHQRRKLTWDFWGFLMMMVNSDCGPGSGIRIGDHHLCHQCTGSFSNEQACQTLCEMSTYDHHKASYFRFCDESASTSDSSGSSSAYVANANDGSGVYGGNTSPGGIGSGGSYSKSFPWWMFATAAAVLMAMVAIHMGQRKDHDRAQRSNMTGAVGKRYHAVEAFVQGFMPSKNVELAAASSAAAGAYALDGENADDAATAETSEEYTPAPDGDVDVDNPTTSTAGPAEQGVEQSYIV
mmetsp:Transcript_5955/g.10789  ORF Transcript_5955/g.10789 Transcript_5955/m.10789 type:complete len:290 (+) Transcript_5955:143-1012(+)|eukprot:CAMPEP_0178753620 /NCGR_PEP_ID=MMETSP0744-20121128/11707_1 /TAXON_ID=913974 /ORGANISM="Nitzschia punctata, Strain CCMP561" /LENGTH=289 /DNA_ID=CAMNT_0020407445 /DNA_START=151 /DNA_END=1020 /DNA_ORIENTATION=-